jgi:hypothetical protein
MLFDPKWEVKTKADPLSLDSLIAWLETMPEKARYDYSDCDGACLIDQYGAAINQHNLACRAHDLAQIFGDLNNYPRVCGNRPWTFGAALDRARKLHHAG